MEPEEEKQKEPFDVVPIGWAGRAALGTGTRGPTAGPSPSRGRGARNRRVPGRRTRGSDTRSPTAVAIEFGYIIHGIHHPAAYIGHFRPEPNVDIQPSACIGLFERCQREHWRA